MSEPVSFYAILRDEEELVQHMLDCVVSIADLIDVCSIVDNGSNDDTLDIVMSYKDKLPLMVRRKTDTVSHGELRNKALEVCRAPYVLFLDGDETWTSNFHDWLASDEHKSSPQWDFFKYSTIVDRYHYCEGGNGPSYRMFRNDPGVTYTQLIHTEAFAPGITGRRLANGPIFFDASACKSLEARWAKGWRYRHAFDQRVPGVGDEREYIWRNEEAYRVGSIREFDDNMKALIAWGP